MRACFDAVTVTPARDPAAWRATASSRAAAPIWWCSRPRDPVEAIRLRATRLAVMRAGNVIASSAPATAVLDLPGTAGRTGFRL